MTPGARLILNDYMQPRSKRVFVDNGGLLPALRDAHFFDVTAIMPIARQLAFQMAEHGSREVLGFLPAPAVWLEWRGTGSDRFEGRLLRGEHGAPDASEIDAHWCETRSETFGLAGTARRVRLYQPPSPGSRLTEARRVVEERWGGDFLTLALLACINTPRVIGRKTHLPAAKLQRAFAKGRPVSSSFPIGAWTELLLEVAPPRIEGGPSRPGYLTGARALHFVRAHLRVRMGMLELIRAHHRGDASLGIKQTRYRLVA